MLHVNWKQEENWNCHQDVFLQDNSSDAEAMQRHSSISTCCSSVPTFWNGKKPCVCALLCHINAIYQHQLSGPLTQLRYRGSKHISVLLDRCVNHHQLASRYFDDALQRGMVACMIICWKTQVYHLLQWTFLCFQMHKREVQLIFPFCILLAACIAGVWSQNQTFYIWYKHHACLKELT